MQQAFSGTSTVVSSEGRPRSVSSSASRATRTGVPVTSSTTSFH